MPHARSERGFTLVELMIATLITSVIMGVAFSTFRDSLALNDAVVNMAESTQNLRAGTNLLVRDLVQAGRGIDIGGIPVPSGPTVKGIIRPGPMGIPPFDNDEEGYTLTAIVTGDNLGPTVSGRDTDVVSILVNDAVRGHLDLFAPASPSAHARLAADGSSFDAAGTGWLAADKEEGITAIKKGDLLHFSGTSVGSALQTVTDISGTIVTFAANDPFLLNQRGPTVPGSITQIIPSPLPSCDDSPASPCKAIMKVQRVYMYTYFVQEDEEAIPRLMRVENHGEPQALAGAIEDLELTYDLVDGDETTANPVNVKTLPFTANSVEYSASQIRKVNVHVGVRSEVKSGRTNDYLRNHLSTVISLRNLAYVDRYQ
jgi:prepilin-type N-terminal cleavage/methylation domain-containing protein